MIANYLVENVNLTGLTKFLNEVKKFKKNSNKPFTTNDVSQYILLGHIPYYLGGNKIDSSDLNIKDVKLYNLRK